MRSQGTLHALLIVTGRETSPLLRNLRASFPCSGSQVSPGEGMIVSMGTVAAPCPMVNGMVPVSPARTTGSVPRIKVMGKAHSLLIWKGFIDQLIAQYRPDQLGNACLIRCVSSAAVCEASILDCRVVWRSAPYCLDG